MRSTPKTNVEIITEIMEFSRCGALAQLFIMDSVARHAERIAAASLDELKSMEGGLISPAAWKATAAEIAEKMRKHLTPEREPVSVSAHEIERG